MNREGARVVLGALALRDFRNLARLDLGFPSSGAVVVGENGQGKSNLLEAIYYLHLLRSVRGARDVDVVRLALHEPSAIARTKQEEPEDEDRAPGGVVVDISRKRVLIDGESAAFTFKEFELLQYLVLREGRTIERAELVGSLWHSATDEESPGVADTLGAEDDALEGVEYRESLKPLLEQLPPREKKILLLRFFGNMTQSQIAQEVGISQMHVSRLLARTLAQLRERLLVEE